MIQETTFGSMAPIDHIFAQHGYAERGYVFVRAAQSGLWRAERVRIEGRSQAMMRVVGIHAISMPGLARDWKEDDGDGDTNLNALRAYFTLALEQKRVTDKMPGLGPNVLGGGIPCDEPIVWALGASGLTIGGERLLVAIFESRYNCPVMLPAIGATCVRVEAAP